MVSQHHLPQSLFMDLDRTGPVPIYYQVAVRLERAIVEGVVPPGARIENEVALSERLGISRPTIRRAIQELVDKGLVVRRRGIGTQVVHGGVSRNVELTSLFEDLQDASRKPTTEIILHQVIPVDAVVAERLGLNEGSPVLHLRRCRFADRIPLAILENFLPEPFTDLSELDLIQFGLYQLLRSRGATIRVARERIGARTATAEESNFLDLERGSALLTMDRIAYSSSAKAIEFGHHVYRPDLYSFDVTLVGK